MRPPSYYTSLANSNAASNRNSSQQLRSSFSSSPSSSYVSRTHLPFVPQSTLVAHCFTGVGSSTKPYGYSSSYTTSNSYSPNYSTSYSRPHSTKRQPASSSASYLSSSSLYSATPRTSSVYLGASSSARTTSSYRPAPAAYYKPIRLRERPILTQISRQINASAGNISTRNTLTTNTSPSNRVPHSERNQANDSSNAPPDSGPTVAGTRTEVAEESWSSDVARNISRNKYLIKFREIDKRPAAAPIQLNNRVTQIEPSEMRIPANTANELAQPEGRTPKLDCDVTKETPNVESLELKISENEKKVSEKEKENGKEKEKEKGLDKKKATRPKRNMKLKIKTTSTSATSETNQIDLSEVEPKEILAGKQLTEVQVSESLGKAKAKKTTKASKTTSEPKPDVGQLGGGPKSVESKPEAVKLRQDALVERKLKEKTAETDSKRMETIAKTNDMSPVSAANNKRIRFRDYHLEDFNFLSVLGHGGWGFVILAELKEHDACFAVKCIKKITIVEDDDLDSIMIERKVLALGNEHPFICKLFCTFETDGYLFFVMEFCAGGDLMFHVQKEGKFSESRCRFYAAEIICAIRFLHNRHIIYRDLKLDNILLDSRGHIRLVDFGMCQCRTYREEMLPSNFCGTPEYISPEIIKGVPYNHSVDWWSFGVLLYEMAVGKMPFRGNDENELLWNVCYEQIHYPMFLSKELTTLLQSLLEREPSKRMGMATCKAGDIYDQVWFRGVDWPAIEAMRVPPPFVPEVASKRDVRNFDDDFTESAPELSPVDAATLSKIEQSQFQRFPYTNPNIFIFDSC